MSYGIMILGESGTGKSASLRNLDPANTLLIQAIRKPLPFRSAHWKPVTEGGNIYVSDKSDEIIHAMNKTSRRVIVLDDFQYILANEFMRRSSEKGYEKFTEIGRHAWDILNAASTLAPDKRVYILAHTEQTEHGKVKAKTIGKLLDEKITIEGMFSVVLRTIVSNGNYLFSTRNNGQDTVKTPIGMFDEELIENDLAAVDAAIVGYYGLSQAPSPAPTEQAKAKPLPPYPDDSIFNNIKAWIDVVAQGKKTADEIINTIKTKGTLTHEQEGKIRQALTPQQTAQLSEEARQWVEEMEAA